MDITIIGQMIKKKKKHYLLCIYILCIYFIFYMNRMILEERSYKKKKNFF